MRDRHGMSYTKIYKRWTQMLQRCYNENNRSYRNYGGRGISVCIEWHKFINFYNWVIVNGFSENLELDRKDNNKSYCPDNCRFVTSKVNRLNRDNIVWITAFGETKTSKDWADDYRSKVTSRGLRKRINKGCNPENAITMSHYCRGKIKFRGVTYFKNTNKYQARIVRNKKTLNLGFYFSAKSAAAIYNVYAYKFWGDRAFLNNFT